MSAGGLLEKSSIGKREDLSDLIAIADARGTPFTAMVDKSKKLTNTFYEWELDKYSTPKDPTSTTSDGTDVTEFENAQENKARIGAYIHYFRRTGKVSKLAQNLVTYAGEPSPIGKSRAKALIHIARDQEVAHLGEQEMRQDTGVDGQGYCQRGLGKWIQATAQDLNPVPTAYRPAAAQINTTATASLAEDTDMSGVLKAIFDATGMTGSYYLFAGSTLRTAFTTMTRMKANAVNSATKIRNLQGEIEDSTISSTTSIFRGDYGNIEVLSSSWISWASSAPQLGDGLLLDMDKIHLRTAEHPDIHPLEDKGGGPRFYIDTQCGLQVDNPLGLAKFTP